MRDVCPHSRIILCCWFFVAAQVYPQNVEKTPFSYESFFIEGALHYHFPSGLFSGIIKPLLGFRGTLGYEWQRLRFSFSSGYSRSEGTDPLVVDITFVPLTGRVGYMLPIRESWGVQADLGMGFQFSKTLHYETSLDYLAGRQDESTEIKPFAESRLYTYVHPLKFLKIYAGGGVDVIFETNKPVSLPIMEAGITFKPFAIPPLPKRRAKTSVQEIAEADELEVEIIIEEPEVEELRLDEDTLYEISRKRPRQFEYAVYFEAESGTSILDYCWPLLQMVGQMMSEDPESYVTMRGYAAPFGTTDGQITVSAARVWFCVEYLKKEYGIPEERMHLSFFGADEIPYDWEVEDWDLSRRVELIIGWDNDTNSQLKKGEMK